MTIIRDSVNIPLYKLELDGPIDFSEGEINEHNNTDLFDAIEHYLLVTTGRFTNYFDCDIHEGDNEVRVSHIEWNTEE